MVSPVSTKSLASPRNPVRSSSFCCYPINHLCSLTLRPRALRTLERHKSYFPQVLLLFCLSSHLESFLFPSIFHYHVQFVTAKRSVLNLLCFILSWCCA